MENGNTRALDACILALDFKAPSTRVLSVNMMFDGPSGRCVIKEDAQDKKN